LAPRRNGVLQGLPRRRLPQPTAAVVNAMMGFLRFMRRLRWHHVDARLVLRRFS
jgi:hypothetical protein